MKLPDSWQAEFAKEAASEKPQKEPEVIAWCKLSSNVYLISCGSYRTSSVELCNHIRMCVSTVPALHLVYDVELGCMLHSNNDSMARTSGIVADAVPSDCSNPVQLSFLASQSSVGTVLSYPRFHVFGVVFSASRTVAIPLSSLCSVLPLLLQKESAANLPTGFNKMIRKIDSFYHYGKSRLLSFLSCRLITRPLCQQ